MINRFVRGVAVPAVVLLTFFVCDAQEKVRRVEQPAPYQYPNMPVKVDVKFDDREMLERKAVAGPDWLHRLSIDVTNTSGKSIKDFQIDLILRDAQSSPGLTSVVVSLWLSRSQPKTKMLLPGERTTLKPPQSYIDRHLGLLKEQGTPDIDKVILDARDFVFTDETWWSRGVLMRKDPDTGTYKKVQESVMQCDGPSRSLFLIEERNRYGKKTSQALRPPERTDLSAANSTRRQRNAQMYFEIIADFSRNSTFCGLRDVSGKD